MILIAFLAYCAASLFASLIVVACFTVAKRADEQAQAAALSAQDGNARYYG